MGLLEQEFISETHLSENAILYLRLITCDVPTNEIKKYLPDFTLYKFNNIRKEIKQYFNCSDWLRIKCDAFSLGILFKKDYLSNQSKEKCLDFTNTLIDDLEKISSNHEYFIHLQLNSFFSTNLNTTKEKLKTILKPQTKSFTETDWEDFLLFAKVILKKRLMGDVKNICINDSRKTYRIQKKLNSNSLFSMYKIISTTGVFSDHSNNHIDASKKIATHFLDYSVKIQTKKKLIAETNSILLDIMTQLEFSFTQHTPLSFK